MAASYRAPEAGQLFSTTQAVQDGSGRFADRLETVAGALETYALEVVEIVKQLDLLRFQATRFVASVADQDGPLNNWRKDQAKVDEHQAIWDGVNTAVAAFQAAEVTCADKITALVDGGTRWQINDGSPKQQNPYGFSAEQLAKADSLPWGEPEHREIYPFGIDYHLEQAGISIVDNAVGSVTGLIDLFSPGEDGGAAREGLLRVIIGAEGYLLDPNGDRDNIAPAQKKLMDDSKPYAKEFAKAFVGWDDWDTNPGKAMGTVIFNGLTLGAGPLGAASKAGSGAGKAGTAARIAGAAAKVGEILDPIGAAAKTAGAAARTLPRVADLTAGVRAATDAAAASDAAYSVIEYPNGAQLRIEDGQFIPGNKGVPDTIPAPREPAAADRVVGGQPDDRQLVGAGARTGENTARVGDDLSPQARHDAGRASSEGSGSVPGGPGPSSESSRGHAAEHEGAGRHGGADGSGDGSAGGTGPVHDPVGGNGGADGDPPGTPDGPSSDGGGNAGQPSTSQKGVWPARSDIPGPAAGEDLKRPHPRHTISGSAKGEIKEKNSVILPGYFDKIDKDIADIAAGRARLTDDNNRYEINGRTYGVEPGGRVYPDSGPGIVNLDRNEYAALQQLARAKGDIDAAPQLTRNPRFVNNPQSVQKALDIYNGTYQ
ncbi:hypothetical protein J7E88_28955 [Streptomyces sp. ISL-10]|uniref:hypothetical protein n=1 Tax=Streptomyces sp. ISL-10 TaxID=2819172 RepID=UPI001BE6F457|nr:hypothetical protein [Streptomyces sp. ISL-10]MBT2369234.1 hypothetical protein [Streptomyces sp. ISL-10]